MFKITLTVRPVYFTIDTEHREVQVLAIWHRKRSPAELRRRMK
jgi:hypothetical protein